MLPVCPLIRPGWRRATFPRGKALARSNSGQHIIPVLPDMMCFPRICVKRTGPKAGPNIFSSKVKVFPYFFRLSSTATATETVMPTMGLLPAPRKPIISTSNPPVGGFGPAAQGLLEQEARLFTKQEAHRKKAVCCSFLPWGHLITSCVHETRCFD